MSKTIADAPMTTASARSRLAIGLHWRGLDPEVHLGYRKGAHGGRWLVRWREGRGYRQAALGTADDLIDADGDRTLSFDQAVRRARDHVQKVRGDAAAAKVAAPITVRGAVDAFADAIEARQKAAGRPVSRDARSRMKRHVHADEIAGIELRKLAASDLAAWRERVRATGLAPSSLKRVCNDLRAALNEAGRLGASVLPDSYPITVRDGFAAGTADRVAVATRPNVVLPDADVRRIVAAAREIDNEQGWEGDLARLVLALAATGARFSQLASCKVADLQLDTGRLLVPVSAKGRGVKARSHIAVPIGDDVVAELRRAVAGRRGHEPLFLRWGFKRGDRLSWVRDARRAWARAEISEPFRAIVARADLPADVSAYSLRHSSIVRGLRAGLPVRLVAALHDTSSEMIEKHYSAWIADALGETARLAIVPLAQVAEPVRLVVDRG